jgi:hypothetical protein
MEELVPRPFPLGASPAGNLPDRTYKPQRRRVSGFEVGSLLFPAITAIVGTATVGSLFAAAFTLQMQWMPAQHPAVTSPPPAGAEPANSAGTAAKPLPPVIHRAALAPALLPPRIAAPPPEKSLPPTVRFALAEGDARFADGNTRGARFFYQQAFDAGEAEGALRMGETFDPAFLPVDRLRLVQADPQVAAFWYRRAVALGAAEAKQRLDYLKIEAHDERTTTDTPSNQSRRRATRRHYRLLNPPKVTFYEIPDYEIPGQRKSDGP